MGVFHVFLIVPNRVTHHTYNYKSLASFLVVDTLSYLREKYPNTEFFLFCIFPYAVWVRENTGQKKLRI